MFKYQKIGEMDSEYPFLFCSKSDFWMEIPDDKVNSFENTKRQTPKMTFVFVLNSRLSKREFLLFKEDNIRIWRNIEKLVVFKDQLDTVVFIGVYGVVYSEFRSLFEINGSH